MARASSSPSPGPGPGPGPSRSTTSTTPEGDRLLRRQDGATTIYLPGGQELTLTKGGDLKATRYYSLAGQTVAVRTGVGAAGVDTLVADHHGTAEMTVNNATQQVTRRYHDPYGNARGTSPTSWVDDKGFHHDRGPPLLERHRQAVAGCPGLRPRRQHPHR